MSSTKLALLAILVRSVLIVLPAQGQRILKLGKRVRSIFYKWLIENGTV